MTRPELDDELRARLRRRFGSAVDAWFAELPDVLDDLAARWSLEWGAVIQRGSMSVVIRCSAAGRPAVLKISPARERVAGEAAALTRWETDHVPQVLAADAHAGALLLEAIEPGTPLAESPADPALHDLAALMSSLHASGSGPAPKLADRVAYLFDASVRLYELEPSLVDLYPREQYERSRALALQLAGDDAAPVLLHGDLTPVNVLDGGRARGLVAVDPAPCLGDPAFDAVDLVFFRATAADTIVARAERLAHSIGADPRRLVDWCAAFAGMVAMEFAELGGHDEHVRALLELAVD